MKKALSFAAIAAALVLNSLTPVAASAQAAEEKWVNGIRYLFVYNTTNYRLRCGILDSTGHWFWADILPGQHIWKPVHPSASAQWQCNPV